MVNNNLPSPLPTFLEPGVVYVQPLAHAHPRQTYDDPSAAEDEYEATPAKGEDETASPPLAVYVAVQLLQWT